MVLCLHWTFCCFATSSAHRWTLSGWTELIELAEFSVFILLSNRPDCLDEEAADLVGFWESSKFVIIFSTYLSRNFLPLCSLKHFSISSMLAYPSKKTTYPTC